MYLLSRMSIGSRWFRWVLLSIVSGASSDVVPDKSAPAATMHAADAAKRIVGDEDDDGDDNGDEDKMLFEHPKDRVEHRVTAALGLMTRLLLFATMATPRVSWRGSDIVLG